jgi:CBS domain-containing protein
MQEIRNDGFLTAPRAMRSVIQSQKEKSMEIHGTVRDILQNKGGEVWTTTPQNTVYEAIRLMGEKNIGALIAVEDGQVVGVLSERDYSRKVVLQGRTSRDTLVGEILSRPAVTVRRKDSIEKCMQLMTGQRIRHLPVVTEDNRPVGLVSIGDLVNWVMRSQQHTILQLQGYITGDYPG